MRRAFFDDRSARGTPSARLQDDHAARAPSLSQPEALRRWAMIDRVQRRIHHMDVNGRTRPSWTASIPAAVGMALFGALVSREDPSWVSIGGFFALVAGMVAALHWRGQRAAQAAGLRNHEWRLPRAGRVISLHQWLGAVWVGVILGVGSGSERWWVGVPFGLAAIPVGYWAAGRWYRAFDREPTIRPGGGRPAFARPFASDAALQIGAALALVDWARAAPVAAATGLDLAEVARRADELETVGYLDQDGWDDDRGPALELTSAGRKAFGRHVDWIESP